LGRQLQIPCKFPANSLLQTENCGIWAENWDFWSEAKKFPANFPAIGKYSPFPAVNLRLRTAYEEYSQAWIRG
jgi:hypothetical protein